MKTKSLTRIGFKRKYNKENPLPKGYKRQFYECRKCKNKAAYDFVPYSLSNPILTSPCDHWFKENYKPI
jgi:hypothetical protein